MESIDKSQKTAEGHYRNIRFYWNIFYRSFYFPQKIYVLHMIERELKQLWDLTMKININLRENYKKALHRDNDLREFTRDELKEYDGANGRPAYIAINKIVYDVTFNPQWGGGTHFGLIAGRDLTKEFEECHGIEGGEEILKGLEIVGKLID